MGSAVGRVTGRVALVTGAANGIGRATATLLAEEGAAVTCVDIDQAGADKVAQEIVAAGGRAVGVAADVSTRHGTQEMVTATMDTFGRIDILHNNAGIAGAYHPVHEFPDDVWDRVIATNLTSVFLGSKAVIPHMLKSGGVIVNTCSVFGHFASRNLPAYHAAKGGVLMLTRQMAVDYGPDIRVNCISPGTVESSMLRSVIAESPDPVAREQEYKDSNPVLRRIGNPREIAYGVLFLASDESSFVVGADLFMGGGQGLFSSPTL